MRKLSVLVVCLLATSTLQAMTWQELRTEIDAVEAGEAPNPQIIARFQEIVQMLVSYSAAVREAHPDSQLICPAANVSMHIDEIVSMVRAAAREEAVTDATLVQSLLLDSFRERFPC